MTKPQNLEAIEQATHKPWQEWMDFLDGQSARQLEHKAIAELITKELSGKIDSPGWWAQSVTVAYEQAIGRRAPGQRSDGSFEISVSKTIDQPRENLFARIAKHLETQKEFNGQLAENMRTSVTPVRSYYKFDLGGSKVTWAIEEKSPSKSLLVVAHTNLATQDDAAHYKAFWQTYINKLLAI